LFRPVDVVSVCLAEGYGGLELTFGHHDHDLPVPGDDPLRSAAQGSVHDPIGVGLDLIE
jgi:hypothetical protein